MEFVCGLTLLDLPNIEGFGHISFSFTMKAWMVVSLSYLWKEMHWILHEIG